MSNKFKLEDYLITIDLKTKLKIANEMAFMDFLVQMEFREDKMWTDDEMELLSKLCEYSEKHTEYILKIIDEWQKFTLAQDFTLKKDI